MAIFANYPIVIAPAMGMNAYFAYSVVQKAEGITYVIAFSAVFVTGIIFLLLSFTSFRQKLILAIPDSLKACNCRWYWTIYCFYWITPFWNYR